MFDSLKEQMEKAGIKRLDDANLVEVAGGVCDDCCVTQCCKSCYEGRP